MSLLSRIRKQPQHVRSQLAFFGAVLVTGVIAALWAASLPARFDASYAKDESEESRPSFFKEAFNSSREQLSSAIGALWKDEPEAANPTENEEASATDESTQPPLFEMTEAGIVFEEIASTSKEYVVSASTTATSTTATSSTPEREPRIILIGTTTRQKAE